MAGGKSTPKKDCRVKVAGGELVKTGQIVVRGINTYKAGHNVKGLGTLYALCPGKIQFTRKREKNGVVRTYIHVVPQ
jgi:ribosomal protein L27